MYGCINQKQFNQITNFKIMILEKQKQSEVLNQGESSESIGMSLDMDSAQILMQMLSKNLYSDAIGSTIRECVSNALDSHRRISDNTTPIIVGFKTNEQGNYEFTVEDFGIGLDDDDVKNIISKYGKSTKRDSNNELGMMGLGFKSPLAYSSSFYFIARKNGVERKYMMYEGEDVNTIDLLYEQNTTEKNGVKIIIPVQYYDRNDFTLKMKEQLCYFENVYFDTEFVKNDFVIFRGNDFQYSQLCRDSNLHVCLDNVYYPIDFSKIGISSINCNIGIKLSLSDGVFPTPNRESLRYTKESKQVLLDKINKIADVFVLKYNETVKTSCNLSEIDNYYTNSVRTVHYDDFSVNISNLLKYTTIKLEAPEITGLNILSTETIYKAIKNNYGKTFKQRFYYDGSRMYDNDKSGSYRGHVNFKRILEGQINLFSYTENIKGIYKDYIKWCTNSGASAVLRKYKTSFKLYSSKNSLVPDGLIDVLNLRKVPKNLWRDAINEFYSILSLLFKNVVDLDTLQLPKAFLDDRAKATKIKYLTTGVAVRKKKSVGEIIYKIAEPLERYVDGKNCKFVSGSLFLEDLHKYSSVFIYTSHEDSHKLDDLFLSVEKMPRIKLVTFSARELVKIKKEESNKLISYEEFMKGKVKQFRKIATSIYVSRLLSRFCGVRNKRELFDSVKSSINEDMQKLLDYSNKNYCSNSTIYENTILDICLQNDELDYSIVPSINNIENTFKNLEYVDDLLSSLSYGSKSKSVQRVLVDVLKYNKIKVDLNRYRNNLSK